MIQVNIFISTFLVFLCCISQVSHVSAYSRFAGYIFSSRRSDLRALKSNFVDLNLGQSFQIDYFLKKYQVGTSRIQGVFAIEDKDGNVQVVDSGIDIAADISSILEHYKDSDYNFSVVRVQYFMDASSESLEAYCKELSKQTNPLIIKNEALNSKIRIVAPPTSTTSTIESPFASGGNVESNKSKLELTKANVNAVLDEIRPFLIADGGNVAVVNVDSNTRNIELSLQGACGSCPSSTTTMKMGIERILNERFPNLGSIVAVNTAPKLTSQDIDQSLEKLLPAIRGLGGVVVIKDVDSEAGKVLVDFSGPPRLKTGIELVLKDNPLVKEVVFNVIA